MTSRPVDEPTPARAKRPSVSADSLTPPNLWVEFPITNHRSLAASLAELLLRFRVIRRGCDRIASTLGSRGSSGFRESDLLRNHWRALDPTIGRDYLKDVVPPRIQIAEDASGFTSSTFRPAGTGHDCVSDFPIRCSWWDLLPRHSNSAPTHFGSKFLWCCENTLNCNAIGREG